jgi:hypothetical protein
MNFKILFITFSFLFVQLSFADPKLDVQSVHRNLIENYNYLIDSQVKCAGSYAKGKYICNKEVPGERRILGSWDSYIVPVFMKFGVPVKYVDSNMFVTAHTVFPLYFMRFGDEKLEKKRQDAIYSAMNAINIFKRDDSFAFWPEIGGSLKGQVNRVGPLNLSPLLLSSQIRTVNKVQEISMLDLLPENVKWMEEHLDLDNEELGMDALFSVPNDADDTALGIVSNFYFYKNRKDKQGLEEYLDMTKVFNKYTDTYQKRNTRRFKKYKENCKSWYDSMESNQQRKELFLNKEFLKECSLDDGRESWRYDNEKIYSGSYLTWLYDENKDVYANAEKGVALPGQNSVDCNVVSNVLYSLSLTEKRKEAEFRGHYVNSCNTISDIILDDNNELRYGNSPREIDKGAPVPVWSYCGLFYPAHMTFPYLISKAISEAQTCQDLPKKNQERFDLAMSKLVESLIEEQDYGEPGKWYEKIDESSGLSTAFGGVSLANFYFAYGEKLGVTKVEYKKRISAATGHIIQMSKKEISSNGDALSSLEAGTFFGGGTINEIAHWRSRPFSTSVSLELMMKYLKIHNKAQVGNGLFYIGGNYTPLKYSKEQEIITVYKKESIAPIKEYGIHLEAYGGMSHKKESHGNSVNEAIIGVELSIGDHFSGNIQESNELVAFYKVKLNSEFGIDLSSGNINKYFLDAKFMGVSTKTKFIVNDEVGYLPISYVKEEEFKQGSIHAAYANLKAPIYKINDQVRLDISLTGKILGLVHFHNYNGGIKNTVSSLNLADFEIGLSLESNKFTTGIYYGSAIGYSENNHDKKISSHKNYEFGLKSEYSVNDKHKFSFSIVKNTKINKSEPEIKLEYQYQFK